MWGGLRIGDAGVAADYPVGAIFDMGRRCARVCVGFLRGAAYGKVKAALGCFDERRLLLEPSWAEMSGGVLAYRPLKKFKRSDSMGALLIGLA